MVKKINVLGLDGKKKGSVDLPNVFSIIPRLDLIERAVISTQAAQKQPQGRDPLAGKRNTAPSGKASLVHIATKNITLPISLDCISPNTKVAPK
jgi:hypothetical protein